MIIVGSHDTALVALSILIAVFASYTALDLAGRIRAATGWVSYAWLAAAALAMGGGIWSMHFVAMLAFSMPSMPMSYDVGLTLLSMLVAVAATGVAFQVVSRKEPAPGTLLLSGGFMGLGIVAMHYTGMAAMRMPADLRYDRLLVALSVLIAVGAATVALWLASRMQSVNQRVAAAIAMGLAISGMHYTGMQAATFTAHAALDHAHGYASLEQTSVALAVAMTTFIILFLALVASIIDRRFALLTEREALALRASEERFRSLYRDTPLPLHSVDADDKLIEVSDQWLELLGYARDEVIGRPMEAFMTEESAHRRRIGQPTLLAGGEIRDAEFQFASKTGETIDVLLSARLERDADGRFLRTVGGLIDVTARKRAEEALRQAQKMEAVGQLTGGVAHDFNNLLTVVLGNLELAERALDTDNSILAHRTIETARRGAERAAALTERLLAFSRRQALQPQSADINKLVSGLSDLVRRTLGERVAVKTALAGDIWRTYVDPNQLESAILNLVINARDAMPDGGKLTIETANCHLDEAYAAAHAEVSAGQYVLVAVSDTGSGMAPEVIERAFEPFYTTKGVGKGTGLGLSQVFGFVKQSGGHVTIYSEVGRGTTVRIYLPRHMADEKSSSILAGFAEGGRPEPLPATPAGETVLVVEDDTDVRAYSVEALKGLGYRIVEAADASSALSALEAHPEIRVLFTDVGLPGLDGRKLVEEAKRRRSDLRVLFTTGYTWNAVVHNGVLDPGVHLLNKPFTTTHLAHMLRRVIEAADSPSPSGRVQQ
jgi:PAS domain S-box-containing protein